MQFLKYLSTFPLQRECRSQRSWDFTGTGSFISFTADPADSNGDGIVTSAEQMLYDSTHLFVTTTT